MHLLNSSWIPIQRASGQVELIAPWRILDHGDDPITALASARPDFDGALAQFLIGILQTAIAPATESEWRRRFRSPPKPEELREAFSKFDDAFELLGDGPRFFQDLTLAAESCEPWPIEKLLISNGMSEGKDHFVRSGGIAAMCLPCAATALMCLQSSAPSGGVGHRVSLRGGGPLTTLVWTEESLWAALWLNVLTDEEFREGSLIDGASNLALVFPWLAPARTSEGGRVTTFADIDPLQMYWAMPRRIRLSDPHGEGSCGACGASQVPVIRSFTTKNYGISYTGAFPHPLTPYRGKPGESLPVKGDRTGLAYREFLGLVQNDSEREQQRARVVDAFVVGRRGERTNQAHRLWAFGYAVDNLKPILWSEGTMPLLDYPEGQRELIEGELASLVAGAREVQAALRWAAKQALTSRPRDLKSVPAEIAARFWQESEAGFYDRLRGLSSGALEEDAARELREGWHDELRRLAERIFDDFAGRFGSGSVDPGRIARAGNGLRGMLQGKKVRDALRLPVTEGANARRSRAGRRGSRQPQEGLTDGR